MGQVASIILVIILWVISFVEPSGWGMAMDIPTKVNGAILFLTVIFLLTGNKKRRLPISPYLVLGIVFFMAIVPYLRSNTWQGASYLTSFLTVYVVSQCKVTRQVVALTGIAIAALGLIVMVIYTSGSLLSGWNDNAVSMVGLFSFLYFSIFLISKRHSLAFWFWNLVTVAYLSLLFKTDCRSGMLFSMMAVAAIYYARPTRSLLQKKYFRLFLLNIPFLVSLLVLAISTTSYYEELNAWSIENTDKPVFNRREELWDFAYMLLDRTDFMGTGKFLINYHNSGVAALSVFGVIGYLLWVKFFSANITYLSKVISDNIVFGCICSFLLIFLQQTVDLGFISATPNLLPYTILGLGIGRARYILRYA